VRDDERPGYLALYQARDDRSGTPEFKSFHMTRQRRAATQRLCSVCGDPIQGPRWSVMLADDPPVRHRDPGTCAMCLAFALRVCPAIVRHRRTDHVEVLKIEEDHVSFDILCAADIEQCSDLSVHVSHDERLKITYRSAIGLALVSLVKFDVMTVGDFLKRSNMEVTG
jgi:hypothetical protein